MNEQVIQQIERVAVIGAGTMGQGIAQLALQAGHVVVLVDQGQKQLDSAKAGLEKLFTRFVEKGKITGEQKQAWLTRLNLATDVDAVCDADLVIEAIVERMDAKLQVFAELERTVSTETILASNTSSLSITKIAASLNKPERFVGLHFFNPPGIMTLVEVINAIQTSETTVLLAEALMTSWGKTPVRCKDTPSFIVNRVARPFYVESFRLLEENAVIARDLDASLRDGMQFRMGPCELTDFIGQDVNYAVSESLWQALRYPLHLRPSFVQGELVAARFLGRKVGRGFYRYDGIDENDNTAALPKTVAFTNDKSHKNDELTCIGILENGVHVYRTQGLRACDLAKKVQLPVALIDINDQTEPEVLAISFCPRAKTLMNGRVPELNGLTKRWVVMPDRPGLINLRVLSLIINEAATATLQGVADETGIDHALIGGVNYPKGAFSWLKDIGLLSVVECLKSLADFYPSGGYAVSPYLLDKIDAEFDLSYGTVS